MTEALIFDAVRTPRGRGVRRRAVQPLAAASAELRERLLCIRAIESIRCLEAGGRFEPPKRLPAMAGRGERFV